MTLEWLIAWIAFNFPLVYSPGPANLTCLALGTRYGFRKALPFILGVNAVIFLYSFLSGFGAETLLKAYPSVLVVMQWLGAIYLVYLAYKFIKSFHQPKSVELEKTPGFMSGVILHALNVKSIMTIFLSLGIFLIKTEPLFPQLLILVAMQTVAGMTSHFLWAGGGHFINKKLSSPLFFRILGWIFGLSLIGVAIWMVF